LWTIGKPVTLSYSLVIRETVKSTKEQRKVKVLGLVMSGWCRVQDVRFCGTFKRDQEARDARVMSHDKRQTRTFVSALPTSQKLVLTTCLSVDYAKPFLFVVRQALPERKHES